ncbi:MAG: LysE family translocator [Spirochaetes bacterium]|nr:LysE family translocator [Spirochaetota bacterium]
MLKTFNFLLTGLVLGFTSGISPGPLFTLLISETLKSGKKGGIAVALAPLITDAPIVLFVLFILTNIKGNRYIISAFAFLGAAYLIYLAILNFRIKGYSADDSGNKHSLKQGVITNFLNPHPYMFWLTIGSALIINSLNVNIAALILFLAGFYSMLVGSKILIALFVDKAKTLINSKLYLIIMKILGAVLIAFAFVIAYDGIKLLI